MLAFLLQYNTGFKSDIEYEMNLNPSLKLLPSADLGGNISVRLSWKFSEGVPKFTGSKFKKKPRNIPSY